MKGKGANMQKKKWDKPELIVLVRGKPEEMVLAQCKGGAFVGPSMIRSGLGCRTVGVVCNLCDAVTSS